MEERLHCLDVIVWDSGKCWGLFYIFHRLVRTKAQFVVSNKMWSKEFTWSLFQTSLTIMDLTVFLEEISFDATELVLEMCQVLQRSLLSFLLNSSVHYTLYTCSIKKPLPPDWVTQSDPVWWLKRWSWKSPHVSHASGRKKKLPAPKGYTALHFGIPD